MVVSVGILSCVLVWKMQDGQQDKTHDQNEACARFRHYSTYRRNIDYRLEREIDLALLDIEKKSSLTTLDPKPVRKIWQIWRDENVPNNFYKSHGWTASHPDWEYQVRVPIVSECLRDF